MRDFPFLSCLCSTILVIPYIYTLILEKKLPILIKIMEFWGFFFGNQKYCEN